MNRRSGSEAIVRQGHCLSEGIMGGPSGENWTWKPEDRMRESYPMLFPSGNFRGRKFF